MERVMCRLITQEENDLDKQEMGYITWHERCGNKAGNRKRKESNVTSKIRPQEHQFYNGIVYGNYKLEWGRNITKS